MIINVVFFLKNVVEEMEAIIGIEFNIRMLFVSEGSLKSSSRLFRRHQNSKKGYRCRVEKKAYTGLSLYYRNKE